MCFCVKWHISSTVSTCSRCSVLVHNIILLVESMRGNNVHMNFLHRVGWWLKCIENEWIACIKSALAFFPHFQHASRICCRHNAGKSRSMGKSILSAALLCNFGFWFVSEFSIHIDMLALIFCLYKRLFQSVILHLHLLMPQNCHWCAFFLSLLLATDAILK